MKFKEISSSFDGKLHLSAVCFLTDMSSLLAILHQVNISEDFIKLQGSEEVISFITEKE